MSDPSREVQQFVRILANACRLKCGESGWRSGPALLRIASIVSLGTIESDQGRQHSMMAPITFEELIARVRRGDEEAVQLLIAEYGEAVRREIRFSLFGTHLRRIISESDIYQSVLSRFCIDLWAGRYEFEGPADLRGLLKAMVRARVADTVKYWEAQKRDMRRHADVESGLERVACKPDESPSQIAAQRELTEEFHRRLSAEERQILTLRQQGLGWPAIEKSLGNGRTADAIRKQYERALSRVSAELGLGAEA